MKMMMNATAEVCFSESADKDAAVLALLAAGFSVKHTDYADIEGGRSAADWFHVKTSTEHVDNFLDRVIDLIGPLGSIENVELTPIAA
jgi:hypothetical protein